MAAVIDLRSGAAVASSPLHHSGQARPGHRTRLGRPALALIEGGRSDAAVARRRIYVRRRVAVAVVGVAALIFLGAGLSTVVRVLAGDGSAATASAVVHRVRPGDTLWSLAIRSDPSADPRDVIDVIVELNSGPSSTSGRFSPDVPLRVGQELLVPADAS